MNRYLWMALVIVGLMAPFVLYPVFVMQLLCFALFACAFNLLIGYTGPSPSATSSTLSRSTVAPSSALSFSTLMRWPCSTRYCLPPVSITAYMSDSPSIFPVVSTGILWRQRPAILAPHPAPVKGFLPKIE